MIIDSILVAFEIPNINLECYSNESRYKKLIKDLFENYPSEYECLDSFLNIGVTSEGNSILYFYYVGCSEVPLINQSYLLNSFKKEIIKLIDSFLNDEGILHKII